MTVCCDICSLTFDSERALRAHEGQTHNNPKPWQNEERLRELYCKKKMSQSEIADDFGTSQETISNWLLRFDIDTRDDREKPPSFGMQNDGYEQWQTQYNGERYRVLVHRLLAVAEYGFDSVVGKEVHHHTNVPWDNRPENIEPLTPSEHRKLHGRSESYSVGDV